MKSVSDIFWVTARALSADRFLAWGVIRLALAVIVAGSFVEGARAQQNPPVDDRRAKHYQAANQIAKIVEPYNLDPNKVSASEEACVNNPKFDVIRYASPVSQEGLCTSCWVHATVSAIETSYRYLTGIMDFAPLSKQEVLDCSGHWYTPPWTTLALSYNCSTEGGAADAPLMRSLALGVLPRSEYLDGNGKSLDQDATVASKNPMCVPRQQFQALLATPNAAPNERVKISAWSFIEPIATEDDVNFPTVASTAKIKLALCRHGGVVSWVDSSGWQQSPTNDYLIGKATTNDITRIGLERTIDSGSRHVIQIVGWNNSDPIDGQPGGMRGFWIIKNSWGTSGAGQGFLKVPFDHQYVGLFAAWIRAINPPSLTETDVTDLLNLKSNILALGNPPN